MIYHVESCCFVLHYHVLYSARLYTLSALIRGLLNAVYCDSVFMSMFIIVLSIPPYLIRIRDKN